MGGSIGIVGICLGCCMACLKMTGADESTLATATALIGGPACCMFLFNIAWAGVGLYMYEEEMNPDCQDEDIGTMVFAWSLIQYCIIALICCCACFMGICGGAFVAASVARQ